MWRLVVLACMLTTGCTATAESGSAGSPSTSAAGVPSSSASPSGKASPSPTQQPKPGPVVIAADSAYGPMLYDATGQPIYLFTAERVEKRIPRASVDVIQQSKLSIMPQGLDAQLSRDELRDLIAFLLSLK